MKKLSEKLNSILQLKMGTVDILRNRENSQLEFKETFNLGSRAKYAKTAASFANNKGGYLVFGVTKEPHRLKGLNVVNFESCDPAKLTEFFNSNFTPEIEWEMGTLEFSGHILGYIYIQECLEKPIIATTTNGNDFQEAGIYYRYRGQSTSIKYTELRNILDSKISRERQAWLQHLSTIARSGPTNVGIVDTVTGRLFGGSSPFLIDEALLSRLKFIRQGQFDESNGEPTLRLLGDLHPIAGLITEKSIQKGIHTDDLVSYFLAEQSLDARQAIAFLRETVYQASPYLPVHFFFSQTGLSETEARELLSACPNPKADTYKKVIKRLFERSKIAPLGAISKYAIDDSQVTANTLLSRYSTAKSQITKRSLAHLFLCKIPNSVYTNLEQLESIRICEAITHLSDAEILKSKTIILKILTEIYEKEFHGFCSADKTNFRKALAFCDEALYKQ